VSAETVTLEMVFDVLDWPQPIFAWDFYIPIRFYSDKARVIESVVGSLQIHSTIN